SSMMSIFFFQAEDGIRDYKVTGVQTCALPISMLLGGGFGRRANPASDFIIEAVNVAKVAKAPVKVVWTREDDLAGGWYRPMWHEDRKSTRLNSSHLVISYAVFCLKKKKIY